MHPVEDDSIQHVGRSAHRLSTSPREAVFAEAWRKQQEFGHTLQWLLCASRDQQIQDRQLTQDEATCAATVMQWLGSPVGWNWLHETIEKARKA